MSHALHKHRNVRPDVAKVDDTLDGCIKRLSRPISAMDFAAALGVVVDLPLTTNEARAVIRSAHAGARDLQAKLSNPSAASGERASAHILAGLKA